MHCSIIIPKVSKNLRPPFMSKSHVFPSSTLGYTLVCNLLYY